MPGSGKAIKEEEDVGSELAFVMCSSLPEFCQTKINHSL